MQQCVKLMILYSVFVYLFPFSSVFQSFRIHTITPKLIVQVLYRLNRNNIYGQLRSDYY